MTATSTAPRPVVRWRSLDPGFWVARRDDRHLGAVERGRRWIATDADSRPLGRYRTFAEARAAVAEPEGRRTDPRLPASWGGLVLVGMLSASAAALLAVRPLLGM